MNTTITPWLCATRFTLLLSGALVGLVLTPSPGFSAETASGTTVPKTGDDIAINNVFRPPQDHTEGAGGAGVEGDGQASHDNQDPATGPKLVKIIWPKPAAIPLGTALSRAQLNAQAPIKGSFYYEPSEGAVLGAGANQKLTVTFTPMDRRHYKVTTFSVPLTVVAPRVNAPQSPLPKPVVKPTAKLPAH